MDWRYIESLFMSKLRSCPHVKHVLNHIEAMQHFMKNYVDVRSENRDYPAEFSCRYSNQ